MNAGSLGFLSFHSPFVMRYSKIGISMLKVGRLRVAVGQPFIFISRFQNYSPKLQIRLVMNKDRKYNNNSYVRGREHGILQFAR